MVAAEASIPCEVQHCDSTCYKICTSLHDIDANVIDACIDLLLHEFRWYVVDVKDFLSVLSSQCCRSGHSIAAMGGDHLLIGF